MIGYLGFAGVVIGTALAAHLIAMAVDAIRTRMDREAFYRRYPQDRPRYLSTPRKAY